MRATVDFPLAMFPVSPMSSMAVPPLAPGSGRVAPIGLGAGSGGKVGTRGRASTRRASFVSLQRRHRWPPLCVAAAGGEIAGTIPTPASVPRHHSADLDHIGTATADERALDPTS